MNFQNAVLLIAAVFGTVELTKSILPNRWTANKQIVVGLVLLISLGITLLLAHTAWAHEQVIGDKSLDNMNFASQILVGIMVAGAASFGSNFLYSVRNLGQNQPQAYDPNYGTPTTMGDKFNKGA